MSNAEEEENFIQRMLAEQARQKVCRLRKAAGWSYQELAARSDISPETLKDLEEGRKSMTPYHLRNILDAHKYLQAQPQPTVQ